MTFMKYSCGCIGFDVIDGSVIVKDCRSEGSDIRNSEDDVQFGFRTTADMDEEERRRLKAFEGLPAGLTAAPRAPLTAAESEVWEARVRKQLWAGSRLRDIQSLIGIEVK